MNEVQQGTQLIDTFEASAQSGENHGSLDVPSSATASSLLVRRMHEHLLADAGGRGCDECDQEEKRGRKNKLYGVAHGSSILDPCSLQGGVGNHARLIENGNMQARSVRRRRRAWNKHPLNRDCGFPVCAPYDNEEKWLQLELTTSATTCAVGTPVWVELDRTTTFGGAASENVILC